MEIEFRVYGCRGTIPFASKCGMDFGCNTSSYTLRMPNGTLFFLDAGSGILEAQEELLEKPKNAYLMLSHPHHDHLCGLGVSSIPYRTDIKTVPVAIDFTLETLEKENDGSVFPVKYKLIEKSPPDELVEKEYGFFGNGEIMYVSPIGMKEDRALKFGETEIRTCVGNHPRNGCNIYRFDFSGRSIVYATDNEFSYIMRGGRAERAGESWKNNYMNIIRDADFLVADAQYTAEEYKSRKGWGHSYPEEIIGMASEAGVKKLLLTHHAPLRPDNELYSMENAARNYAKKLDTSMSVDFAKHRYEYRMVIG